VAAKSIVSVGCVPIGLSEGLPKVSGDEFNVQSCRSINLPIYSFDYGDFKIFGSSPEAQIIVNRKPKHILSPELLNG
jgi:hypothetical protein